LASDITKKIIANVTRNKPQAGPEYDEAVRTGTEYWTRVLEGKNAIAAKEAHDMAMTRLLGCKTEVRGKRYNFFERVRRITRHDAISTRDKD
jgi:hypothetical protein